jgi:hypothetical protein
VSVLQLRGVSKTYGQEPAALVASGQVTHPSQVIMLLGPPAVQQAVSHGNVALPGIPAAAAVVPRTEIEPQAIARQPLD